MPRRITGRKRNEWPGEFNEWRDFSKLVECRGGLVVSFRDFVAYDCGV
jgi:hypothetical protein